MTLASTIAIAGGVAAVGSYLNARFHLVQDARLVYMVKKGEKHYNQLVSAWTRSSPSDLHSVTTSYQESKVWVNCITDSFKEKENRLSPWYLVAEACEKYSENRAIWSRTGCYTFGELYDHSLRYAQWLLSQGVKPGDLVAMYLQNSPEFVFLWFATLCVGAAPALINHSLEGKALLHCLDVCKAKVMVVDEDPGCQDRINASRPEMDKRGMSIFTLNDDFKKLMLSFPNKLPGDELRKDVKPDFPIALIYTSGTTGHPKGVSFTTGRFQRYGPGKNVLVDSTPGFDCWYVPMPMYHGTAAIISALQLVAGTSLAITPRFSVRNFWSDVHDSGATWFIYVGETARYLLNAPPHPLERKHNLRGAYGNGLRPDVWRRFQERFNVPEIAEFFNSSEGMFALLNHVKGPYRRNCVGHHGLILRTVFHKVYIPLRIDHETGDIWRDPKTGFGQRMSYKEGGEVLVAVPDEKAFPGYWGNDEATNKKFARDVFKKGDLYYRSGDALRRSSDGKWFFMDRLGDTFRWKSENVSTAEVSECLGHFPGVSEANVYGVLVPNAEGRAGCAALHIDGSTFPKTGSGAPDYNGLLGYAKKNLPKFAVPVFLRIVKAGSHMHNNKQNKMPLQREGVDPALRGTLTADGREDSFLWLKPGQDKYVPFETGDWDALKNAQARL